MIHISLSPNLERDDKRRAFVAVFSPWKWKRGKEEKQLADFLERYFDIKNPLLVSSARCALFLLLKALGVEKGDEVLVQGFTCNAVPNPVLWCEATPIYVDIEQKGFNMDPLDLERKITPRSRAVVVQHTFGMAAQMEQILRIARNHKLFVIEDCAHSIGSSMQAPLEASQEFLHREGLSRKTASPQGNTKKLNGGELLTGQGKKLGTLADAMIISFGRDKCISSVYGGALLIQDAVVAEHAKSLWEQFPYPSAGWILQQLLHPVVTSFVRATYGFGGKIFLYVFQRMHILSLAVTKKEKQGEMPSYIRRRLPSVLAGLACHQFQKIDRFVERRKELASFYARHIPAEFQAVDQKTFAELEGTTVFLRYPLRHEKRNEILRAAKKEGMVLGDWYSSVIDPRDTNKDLMRYKQGSCPNAEARAQETLNLPTDIHTTLEDAGRIVGFFTAMHES